MGACCVLCDALVVPFMHILGSFVGLKDAVGVRRRMARRRGWKDDATSLLTPTPSPSPTLNVKAMSAALVLVEGAKMTSSRSCGCGCDCGCSRDARCVAARTLHNSRDTLIATPSGDLAGAKSESCSGRDGGKKAAAAPLTRGLPRCSALLDEVRGGCDGSGWE